VHFGLGAGLRGFGFLPAGIALRFRLVLLSLAFVDQVVVADDYADDLLGPTDCVFDDAPTSSIGPLLMSTTLRLPSCLIGYLPPASSRLPDREKRVSDVALATPRRPPRWRVVTHPKRHDLPRGMKR